MASSNKTDKTDKTDRPILYDQLLRAVLLPAAIQAYSELTARYSRE